MNAPNGQDIWYLARDGKQHGPLSDLEMTKLVELGHLRATDLVWRPGFSDWRPAPNVFPALAVAPAPSRPAVATAPAKQGFIPAQQTAGAVQPRVAEPAAATAFEAAAHTRAMAEPTAREPETQRASEPAPVEARSFRPANAPTQFGTPVAADEPRPESYRMEPRLEPMFPDATPKRRSGMGVALSLLLIGGLAAGGYVYRDEIKAVIDAQLARAPASVPVVEAPVASGGPAPATSEPTTVAATDPAPAAPVPAAPVTAETDSIDAGLQKSPFWSLAKTEFPEWYAERLREVKEMTAAGQPDGAINAKLMDAVVALRRQNASKALAASPARLQLIAETFVANLGAMQSQSVDACYDFIGKGELTPAAAALVQKPTEGAPLHAQLAAVLTAVVDGQAHPVTRTAPQTTDYNLLAAELGTIGWSQADIQLFADPKALANAPRDQVCKMVRDWFSAHLAVKDDAARERLLFETLRLVIAG